MLLSVQGNAFVVRLGVRGVADSAFELKRASGSCRSARGGISSVCAARILALLDDSERRRARRH